jgi:hypothetical protein
MLFASGSSNTHLLTSTCCKFVCTYADGVDQLILVCGARYIQSK